MTKATTAVFVLQSHNISFYVHHCIKFHELSRSGTVPYIHIMQQLVASVHDNSTSMINNQSVTVTMELEALIKHLLSELRNRETVILDNIDSLKVGILSYLI